MIVVFTTRPAPIAGSRRSRRKPSSRAASARYGAGGCWLWSGVRRRIASAGSPRRRSSSPWRAASAAVSSARVSVRTGPAAALSPERAAQHHAEDHREDDQEERQAGADDVEEREHDARDGREPRGARCEREAIGAPLALASREPAAGARLQAAHGRRCGRPGVLRSGLRIRAAYAASGSKRGSRLAAAASGLLAVDVLLRLLGLARGLLAGLLGLVAGLAGLALHVVLPARREPGEADGRKDREEQPAESSHGVAGTRLESR